MPNNAKPTPLDGRPVVDWTERIERNRKGKLTPEAADELLQAIRANPAQFVGSASKQYAEAKALALALDCGFQSAQHVNYSEPPRYVATAAQIVALVDAAEANGARLALQDAVKSEVRADIDKMLLVTATGQATLKQALATLAEHGVDVKLSDPHAISAITSPGPFSPSMGYVEPVRQFAAPVTWYAVRYSDLAVIAESPLYAECDMLAQQITGWTPQLGREAVPAQCPYRLTTDKPQGSR